MKIKSGYLLTNFADAYVVVPVSKQIIESKGVMILNHTGAYIFKCLENEITYDNLLQKILDKYEISKEIATVDLDEFLLNARDTGVIEDFTN